MAEQIAYDQIGGGYSSYTLGDYGNFTNTDLTNLNGRAASISVGNVISNQGTGTYSIWFAEPYDISDYTLRFGNIGGLTVTVFTSANTTNGVDGSWTSRGAGTVDTNWNVIAMPSGTVTNVKGVRFVVPSSQNGSRDLRGIHIYGLRSTTASTNMVEFWHPTNDVVLPSDWLDNYAMYRNGTFTKQFRLKNLSASSTANNITLSSDVLTDAAEPLGPEQEFDDGGTPANPLNIGNLAAGAISSVITYTVTKGATASLGSWQPRIKIQPGSWS